MIVTKATIKALIALAHEAIDMFGERAFYILLAQPGSPLNPTNPPPPVPVPLPVPTTSLPEGFDEAFYLRTYTDVANAVKAGYFTSGADHYIKHGAQEKREYKAPTPVPPPAPAWQPRAAYASSQALVADLKANNCPYMVAVDGHVVYDGDGFGPPMRYYMWRDGTVRQEDSGQIPLPLPPSPSDGEIINLNP